MVDYWLDTSVFIHAKDGPYTFERVPSFWKYLDVQAKGGIISSSSMVYTEIMKGNDYLKTWVRSRKTTLFQLADTDQVQERYKQVADYVVDRYPESQAAKFLGDADSWVIAHAMAHGGVVVSDEGSLAGPNSKTPKIPDVANHFGVRPIHYYGMLGELNATFV